MNSIADVLAGIERSQKVIALVDSASGTVAFTTIVPKTISRTAKQIPGHIYEIGSDYVNFSPSAGEHMIFPMTAVSCFTLAAKELS